MKSLTELNNKIKEFQNRIQDTMVAREKLLDSAKSLEAELLKKKQDLSSIVGSGQIKTLAMERYGSLAPVRLLKFYFVSFLHSEYKRRLIHNTNYEKKLELAEQQIADLKLAQEHLITMGNDVVEQIENSENSNVFGKGLKDF